MDVGNFASGIEMILLLPNDPILTFERKCPLASFGQSKCRVSGAEERKFFIITRELVTQTTIK